MKLNVTVYMHIYNACATACNHFTCNEYLTFVNNKLNNVARFLNFALLPVVHVIIVKLNVTVYMHVYNDKIKLSMHSNLCWYDDTSSLWRLFSYGHARTCLIISYSLLQ